MSLCLASLFFFLTRNVRVRTPRQRRGRLWWTPRQRRSTKTEAEEAPQMIDGKPVVFASLDIREKKNANKDEEE